MSKILKLVLSDHWFEEIKSGRKTHEYRKATPFWNNRLKWFIAPKENFEGITVEEGSLVEFQKAYRKNPERMIFEIKKITIIGGENTDLHCEEPVFDIELGERVK